MKLERADLEDYRRKVRSAILERTGREILNGSADHAAVLIQECFASAQSEILILSKDLDEAVFGRPEVCSAAQLLMADENRSMRILVETELQHPSDHFDWSKHLFVGPLMQYASRHSAINGRPKFEMRSVPKDLCSQYDYNFLVVDHFGFRFAEDRNDLAAVAAFYSSERTILPDDPVEELREIFDDLEGESTSVAFSSGRLTSQS